MSKDIRWLQRYDNFLKAYSNLAMGVKLSRERDLTELEQQGIIQSFEFTFELAWKTMKDYLEYMKVEVKFPRDTIKQGFKYELIENGEIWMDMLDKRNLMAHTYDEIRANQAFDLIMNKYFLAIDKFKEKLSQKKND